MNFPFYIAKRYLVSKSGSNAINIITIIATIGVVIGALALFIILSGFSGLRTFSYSLLDISDPDIKITATKGKVFLFTDELKEKLNNEDVEAYSKVVEERVFLKYGDKRHIAQIKGVDNHYNSITKIDSSIIVGQWLDKDFKNMVVLGNGISLKLSLGILNGNPLEIFVPKAGEGYIMNPSSAFSKKDTQVIGIYSGTEEFENKYVFVDIATAQNLLKYKANQISAIEIKTKIEPALFKEKTQSVLGNDFKVQTKAELNSLFYKVINTENLVSYMVCTLIVIIALFNVIGAIIMMIIDKKSNLKTLFSLGASIVDIKKIFVLQGFLLTVAGMVLGLVIGIVLVSLQKTYGFFMITQTLPYPVELRLINILIVVVTILILGYLAAKVASSRISESFIEE